MNARTLSSEMTPSADPMAKPAPVQMGTLLMQNNVIGSWCVDGGYDDDFILASGTANPPTATEVEQRARLDAEATAEIPKNIEKYTNIVRSVNLFSEMGDAEIEAAALALQVKHFKDGEVIYNEEDEGHDAWVIESGIVVASILIPGIRFAGTWEWKETRKYSPSGTPFFGERGLMRKEPRTARMTCRGDVKALRIVSETYIQCARIREYKENFIRGCNVFETMTEDQIGKIGASVSLVYEVVIQVDKELGTEHRTYKDARHHCKQ